MISRNNLTALLSLPLIIGCTTWKSVPPPAPSATTTVLEGEVRVTRVDGSNYLLHGARIENDSLIGTNSAGGRIAIARSDISAMDQRGISKTRTAGLIGGTALAVWAFAVIAVAVTFASIF